jgi:aminoglycoside phosphotransferase family enzyme/predicted kinase
VVSAITQQVVEFLSNAASYPHHPFEVTLVQTHASWVFIASPFVYKIKKPVNLGFLDFSTLELRLVACERELELNRRLAEDIYLGLEPICERDGVLHLGGDGVVIEWAVKMREMDPRFFMKSLLKEHGLGTEDLDRLVERLHRFYTAQPPLPKAMMASATEHLRQWTDDNFKAARGFLDRSLSSHALNAISRFTREFFARQGALLESRVDDGWIRDCHGDLHLEHIHLSPEAVRIYDCIEFNTDFRCIDVACDLAFLAMDLDFNDRPDLARDTVDRFTLVLQDPGMKPLMDFYKCYRACVRGKVESLHGDAETVDEAEKQASLGLAHRYFQLALRFAIAGSQPRAFVFMGKVGSGKSALAEALGLETGWSVLSSDHVRKSSSGIPLHRRGNEQQRTALYAPEMTQRVYDLLIDEALAALRGDHNIIIDATFSKLAQRRQLKESLGSEGFDILWIEACASESVVRQRLSARDQATVVVSDARLEDLEKLNAGYEPPSELSVTEKLTMVSDAKLGQVLDALMSELAVRRASLTSGQPPV